MLAKQIITVLLLVFSNNLLHISGWRSFRVYYTNVSTKSLSDELKLNASVDKTTGSISLYLNVLTNIFKPYVNALVYIDSGNDHYDLELFNHTLNVCTFLQNKTSEPLLQVAYNTLKKYSGVVLPQSCPIVKRLYFIKDIVIDSEKLPPVMPEKKLYIKLTFLSKDDTILKELGVHSGFLRIEKRSKAKLF